MGIEERGIEGDGVPHDAYPVFPPGGIVGRQDFVAELRNTSVPTTPPAKFSAARYFSGSAWNNRRQNSEQKWYCSL